MLRRIVPVLLVAAACSPASPETLTILSHDSFVAGVTDETFSAFTAATGIEVELVGGGDAGAMLNQAIITKDNPIADVLFGVDDTFLARALEEELFDSYSPPLLSEVPDLLELDPQGRATPIDFGDVCLNYDKEAYTASDPPTTLADLIDPTYRNQLVVEHPATSSPGLAFLLATIDRFGEPGWQDYWRGLVANGVAVAAGWDEAYYSRFSGGAGTGDRPLVVSYASSPPAEVIFADPRPEEAPTGVITDGCYRQVEFAGILSGGDSPRAAGSLIDFMLSPAFQEQIPLTWFVFPAHQGVPLPTEFVEHTVIPGDPVQLDPSFIEEHRRGWIEEWTAIVLP